MYSQLTKTIEGGDHLFTNEYAKNDTPARTMIRRDWIQSSSGSAGNKVIPHWFPSAIRRNGPRVVRKDPMYNRPDTLYKSIIDLLPANSDRGLEIYSDIGRSTGWLGSVTDHITVIEDAIEWVDVYDSQSRHIAKRVGKNKELGLEWNYGINKIEFNQYDWIKLEFNAMSMIEQAIQCIKPGGTIICIGNQAQCSEWIEATWAKGLTINAYESRYHVRRGAYHSYISFSINTNGEKQ